jgi:hypothetical protein
MRLGLLHSSFYNAYLNGPPRSHLIEPKLFPTGPIMEFTLTTSPMVYVFLPLVFATYLWLVRTLRWRRYNAMHEKYQAKYEKETLTPEEAQEIIHVAAFYDMPSLVKYSLAFALFKAAAIVSSNPDAFLAY